MKLNFLNWFLPKNTTLQQPDKWFLDALGAPSASGESVNAATAMRVTAVFASVRVLSETIASLSCSVFKRTEDGREKIDHHLNDILKVEPNSENTPFQIFENIVDSVLLQGLAGNQIIRRGGKISEIWPLTGTNRRVKRNGRIVWVNTAKGETREFDMSQVWYTPGLTTRGIADQTPIGIARDAIGNAISMYKFSGAMYANGINPGGLLEFPGTLTDEQFDKIKDGWNERHKGSSNAGKLAILEGGLSWKQTALKPAEAQFIETRKYSVAEIARIFRVPPHMIGDLDKATFSNIEHQSIDFVMHTIRPWLVRIEQSMNRSLLSKKERTDHFIKFNVDALLRGDIKTRTEFYSKGLNDGWLSTNEVRGLEDRNPVEGGDEYRKPMNTEVVNDDSASTQPGDDTAGTNNNNNNNDNNNDNDNDIDAQNIFRLDIAARVGTMERAELQKIFDNKMHKPMRESTEQFYNGKFKSKLIKWLHVDAHVADFVAAIRLNAALKNPFWELMDTWKGESGLDIIELIDNEG